MKNTFDIKESCPHILYVGELYYIPLALCYIKKVCQVLCKPA